MICCWAAWKNLFCVSEFISVLRCSPACFAFCNAVICAAGNCIHCRGSTWSSLKVLYYSLFPWVLVFVWFFGWFFFFLLVWVFLMDIWCFAWSSLHIQIMQNDGTLLQVFRMEVRGVRDSQNKGAYLTSHPSTRFNLGVSLYSGALLTSALPLSPSVNLPPPDFLEFPSLLADNGILPSAASSPGQEDQHQYLCSSCLL